MKTKKITKIISKICSILGLSAMLWSCSTYVQFVEAAGSVQKLTDHFYYMEFSGDYHLEEYLENGGAENNEQMAEYIENLLKGKNINKLYKNKMPLNTGCASISASGEDGQLFGRNYDWDDLTSAMILKSTPESGYKSISTVQLDFLGFDEEFKPDSFGNKYLSIAALFVPLDGMNEKGLCISDLMAGDDEITDQDTGKSNVTTTLAIRGILDLCADVPEAIEFLENHDMHSVIGKAHHFAISDASGRMVVVEYVNNQMIVTEAAAVTNHYLAENCGKSLEGRDNSVFRLGVLQSALSQTPELSEEDVKEVLYNIRASQYDASEKSWWRAVFNQTKLTVNYALEENYDNSEAFEFEL